MAAGWKFRDSLLALRGRLMHFKRSPTLKLVSGAMSWWERIPARRKEMIYSTLASLVPLVGGGLYGIRAGRTREVAEIDPLTGAYRRDQINRLLRKAMRGASTEAPLSVIKVDIDGFKRFNDIFGHDEADRALQIFAQRVKGHLRSNDKVARNSWQMGKHGESAGDELLIILKNVRRAHAEEIAQRIREIGEQMHRENIGRLATGWGVLSMPPEQEIPKIRFGASVGVHTVTDRRAGVSSVLEHAERNMLEEKRRKRAGR